MDRQVFPKRACLLGFLKDHVCKTKEVVDGADEHRAHLQLFVGVSRGRTNNVSILCI